MIENEKIFDLTVQDLRKIIKDIADEAVNESLNKNLKDFLISLGIDSNDRTITQKRIVWIDNKMVSEAKIKDMSAKAAAGIFIAGLAALIVSGIRNYFK